MNDNSTMKLPRHINLTIEHQPHAALYQTVEEWLDEIAHLLEPRRKDRDEMIRTGEVWVVTWYPNTPVGSCSVAASTLERALELANEGE